MSSILYKLFEKTPYGAIYDQLSQNKKTNDEFGANVDNIGTDNTSNVISFGGSLFWFITTLGALYVLFKCAGKLDPIHVLFIIFCPCFLPCYIIYMLVVNNFCNIL